MYLDDSTPRLDRVWRSELYTEEFLDGEDRVELTDLMLCGEYWELEHQAQRIHSCKLERLLQLRVYYPLTKRSTCLVRLEVHTVP